MTIDFINIDSVEFFKVGSQSYCDHNYGFGTNDYVRVSAQSRETFSAKILADSVNPLGERLTTMELTYPRIVHSEFMTHREFSRNSASSRAIPIMKMLTRIRDNPFIPLHWGAAQRGMQAEKVIETANQVRACREWLNARNEALKHAIKLNNLGLHKQVVNRVTEPWMWITVICSSTNFNNFFALRCHPDAEPHINVLANLMQTAYTKSSPKKLEWGDWHLPMIDDEDYESRSVPIDNEYFAKVSAGRCARVSYLTHDTGKRDRNKDVELYERLAKSKPMHASPLEHQAQASKLRIHETRMGGNFYGNWKQFRKMHQGECVR